MELNNTKREEIKKMIRAIIKGDKEEIKLLIENKVDLNVTNDEGDTFLHRAIRHVLYISRTGQFFVYFQKI